MTLRTDAVPGDGSPPVRRAVIAGFSTGLGNVLMDYLAARGFNVRQSETLHEAARALLEVPAELLVVSGRKQVDAVVAIAQQLGAPRTTRIVVLLPSEDRVLLEQYRKAGIHWVLTMPASPDRLDAAALSAEEPGG